MGMYNGGTKIKSFDWHKTIRVLAFCVSVFFLYLSMQFSKDGFMLLGANITPDKEWMGWGIAISFTVLQLVWNKMRGTNRNWTIYLFGILVYAYSIITNILGLGAWLGYAEATSKFLLGTVVVLLSALVEVVPEPLIIWSISGSFTEGGFIDNLIEDTSSKRDFSESKTMFPRYDERQIKRK